MRFTVALAAVLVVLTASPAPADYQDVDPDDSDGIDISRVTSNVFGSPKRIRFRVEFLEDIDWTLEPRIRVEIDSFGSEHVDARVTIKGRTQPRCVLYSAPARARLRGLRVGSDFVSCQLRRSFLPCQPTRSIRWRVIATYLREAPVDDLAPGGSSFYPRA
jgi:hypothetical protein